MTHILPNLGKILHKHCLHHCMFSISACDTKPWETIFKDRQTGRQTNRHTEIENSRPTDGHTEKQTDRQTDIKADRQNLLKLRSLQPQLSQEYKFSLSSS